jgi:hypothetical protein
LDIDFVIPVIYRLRHELYDRYRTGAESFWDRIEAGTAQLGKKSKDGSQGAGGARVFPWMTAGGSGNNDNPLSLDHQASAAKAKEFSIGSDSEDDYVDDFEGGAGMEAGNGAKLNAEPTPATGLAAMDLDGEEKRSNAGDNSYSSGPLKRPSPIHFGWLEKKVFFHSPIAEALISKFQKAQNDDYRLRIVDNIETWNEYFNSGNRSALEVDILQLLSSHRYEHLNSREKLSERLQLARTEELYWKGLQEKLTLYKGALNTKGKDLLLALQSGGNGDNF